MRKGYVKFDVISRATGDLSVDPGGGLPTIPVSKTPEHSFQAVIKTVEVFEIGDQTYESWFLDVPLGFWKRTVRHARRLQRQIRRKRKDTYLCPFCKRTLERCTCECPF